MRLRPVMSPLELLVTLLILLQRHRHPVVVPLAGIHQLLLLSRDEFLDEVPPVVGRDGLRDEPQLLHESPLPSHLPLLGPPTQVLLHPHVVRGMVRAPSSDLRNSW